MNKKIGILTLPLDYNYGGVLQAYALQKYLKNLEYDAWFINRRWNKSERSSIYSIKKFAYKNIVLHNFTKFIQKNITPITSEITSSSQMDLIDKSMFDAIIVGSDQVWRNEHTKAVGNNFYLDFLENNYTKRIAYAASFGIDNINYSSKEKKEVSDLLKKFDAISVREESGLEILLKEFNITGERLIDPTLLLEADDYLKLIKSKKRLKSRKILVSYILDSSKSKDKLIDLIAKEKGLVRKSISSTIPEHTLKYFLFHLKKIVLPSISDWISLYANADFVITDSFHGTIFSILFNKPFLSIVNEKRGATRFYSLLKIFNLEDRLIYDISSIKKDILNKEIDFISVNNILETERQKAKTFMKKNL